MVQFVLVNQIKEEVFTVAKIRIRDLPRQKKIGREEMQLLRGGTRTIRHSYLNTGYHLGSDPYVINDPSPSRPPFLSELLGGISGQGSGKK